MEFSHPADKLEKLVEKSRARAMTAEEREEQRIGFAYGNAPKGDRHTRESVRAIAEIMRTLDNPKN